MEPPVEKHELLPGERQARIVELAESIQLKNPQQFTEIEVDYSKPWGRFRKELEDRIEQNLNDIVVLIQFGQRGPGDHVRNFNPNKAEVLLAKRLPNRVWGDTWAPIMGKIEEKDFEAEFVKDFPRAHFEEFIALVSTWREEEEEARFLSSTPSTVLGEPYLDSETGRIVHVVIKAFPEFPEILERDSPIVAKGDREHSQMKWFKLNELPLDQMAEGTKKALRNALLKLAEIQK
jgi:hypothetical protein